MSDAAARRLRIAEVLPFETHEHSGILGAVVGLATALAHRGHQVEVWEFGQNLPGARLRKLIEAGVAKVTIPVGRPGWLLGRAAIRAVRARSVDVAHLHSVFSPPNNRVAQVLSVPFVLSPHGGYAPEGLKRSRGRKALFKRVMELPMLRKAAMVTALTASEAEDVRRFGFSGPVGIVPQGRRRPARASSADAGSFRASLDIGKHRLALFVGRLDVFHKRLDAMVRGVAATEGWHLALVGPDWHGSARELRKMASRLGAERRIHLPGSLDGERLQAAIAAADVFLLLSRWEGQSLALLEALAAGVPAIVSREVGRVLDVQGAGAGHVIGPDALSIALAEMAATSADVRQRLRRNARRLGSDFSWPSAATALERVLLDVVSGTSCPNSTSGA